MPIPARVLELVETFDRNLEAYRSDAYNETQLRREFIDPFFGELGWDVENKQGYAEPYKDVIHEDAIRVGGATKAPDYCFRIGGARKFFVEAKKPAVNIQESVHPAFQLRRYAWSAKLPLSILTDFEEFAVYDCRVKPVKTDSAATGRTMFLRYADYAARWDELAAIFARESVLKGSFDTYAESTRAKRGTAEVDDAFLKDIEAWRDALARNLALRNPTLTPRELNFAVQRTIDRIIFLRICEDRAVERYGRLQALLNGPQVYPRLADLFRRADERYNSGLFHFHPERDRAEAPDQLTLALTVDDKPLKQIIRSLYYPDSPYEFSVLSADILGQVYEQFLGKVIRLTAGHRAVVEDKPEVKKAGGVYYTPTYIVDYIVEHTVGTLLEGKTPKQAAKLRILDPACGSGSFLIGAYQRLLDWHRDWYVADGPAKWAGGRSPALFQAQGGDWRLTTGERKSVLLKNIYGVDIDPQAVEVTKLSLLLKVLEGETEQSLSAQLRLFHERALPDLGRNIKCGNSLIGPDFYDNRQLSLLDEEERYRVNVFDWNAEFPDIIKSGGFDAVIGNPPYVRIQGFPRPDIEYFGRYYASSTGNFDVYVTFVEKGFSLLRDEGRLGLIVPNKFFRTDYGRGLRDFLATQRAISRIVDLGAHQVFRATTYTCLLFLCKGGEESFDYAQSGASSTSLARCRFQRRPSAELGAGSWGFYEPAVASLLAKLSARTARLLDLPAEMSRGSSTGADEVFVFERGSLEVEAEVVRLPIFAGDFGRYDFAPSGTWAVIFPYVPEGGTYRLLTQEELRTQAPRAFDYLLANQARLRKRKQYKEWFGYSAPRNLQLHDRAQIAIPLLADRGLFALIPPGFSQRLCPMASGGFTIALGAGSAVAAEYVLGLVNSRLLFWRLTTMSSVFRGGWITCTKQYFGELPIRIVDFSNNAERRAHDGVVRAVGTMLTLKAAHSKARTPQERTALERHMDATDRQIDQLVYELYGLTEEEIRIVEEGTAGDFGFSPCAGQRAQAGGQQAR